jgi:2-oxo-4-hydroxy-4-carboxy-5-ureidoimidazoline decarboxylase
MTKLDAINAFSENAARTAFGHCCGSARWAERMAARRPFFNETEMCAVAEEIWRSLEHTDWLEAFTAHPKIGDLEGLRNKFARSAAWCAEEQGGVAGVKEETLHALAEGNRRYEAKFGYIFIVCANGKSAAEMLAILQQRLGNGPEEELCIAAAEQEKIMILRLGKLCK